MHWNPLTAEFYGWWERRVYFTLLHMETSFPNTLLKILSFLQWLVQHFSQKIRGLSSMDLCQRFLLFLSWIHWSTCPFLCWNFLFLSPSPIHSKTLCLGKQICIFGCNILFCFVLIGTISKLSTHSFICTYLCDYPVLTSIPLYTDSWHATISPPILIPFVEFDSIHSYTWAFFPE